MNLVSWCLVFRCLHLKQGTQPEEALQKRKWHRSHWKVKKKRHYNKICIGAAFWRWKTSVSGQLNTTICQESIKWENCEPILHQHGCIWYLTFCWNKITLSTCKKQKEKTPCDFWSHSTGTTEVWAPCIGCVINIAVTSLLVSLWSLCYLLTAADRFGDNWTDVLNLPYSLWFTHCSSFLKHLLTGVCWLV